MKNLSPDKKDVLYKEVDKRFWVIYKRDTTRLSNICRQLALGEGGICWAIINNNCETLMSPVKINTVLIMLVVFFLLDAAQYLFSSTAFKNAAKQYNNQIHDNVIKKESDLKYPDGINTLSNVCFILKLLTLFAASIFLIYLISQ